MEKPDHHPSQVKDSKAFRNAYCEHVPTSSTATPEISAACTASLSCLSEQKDFVGRFAAEIGRNRQPGVDFLRLRAQKPEHIEGIWADEHHVGAIFGPRDDTTVTHNNLSFLCLSIHAFLCLSMPFYAFLCLSAMQLQLKLKLKISLG